jgi:hypothetical protein
MDERKVDRLPKSKYGVVCYTHGNQGMSYEEYMYQLGKADSLWKCPCCGQVAEFDEGRYESHTSEKE